MIAYQMIGSNDVEKAKAFYDQIMPLLGSNETIETPRGITYRFAKGPGFSVTRPFDENPASVGNGVMTAFMCTSPEQVEEVYALAISLGARDEGEPGDRSGYGTFAYFRDMDDNKLCLACFNQV